MLGVLKTKGTSELDCGVSPDRHLSQSPRLVSTWGGHRVETTTLKGVKKGQEQLVSLFHSEVIVQKLTLK